MGGQPLEADSPLMRDLCVPGGPPAARIRLADTRQYLGEGGQPTPLPPPSVRSTPLRSFCSGLWQALTNYPH